MIFIKILLFFILICLSFWIFIQKLRRIADIFLFSEVDVTKIVAVSTAVYSLAAIFFVKQSFICSFIVLSMMFLPDATEYFLIKYWQNKFSNMRISLVNSILLSLSSGKSIRDGVKLGLETVHPIIKKQFERGFLEKSVSERALPKFDSIREMISWLSDAEKQPFAARSLLEGHRRRLFIHEKLVQKSRQVTAQVRAQVVVMTVIYVSLFVWIVKTIEFIKIWRFIFWSLLFYAIGAIFSYYLQRSFRWKI
jgi:hypothetical protein